MAANPILHHHERRLGDAATVFGDLRVLDRVTQLWGAFCARLFGDWGRRLCCLT